MIVAVRGLWLILKARLCCTERGHVNVAAAIVGAPVKVSTELQEVLDGERV
jgi:hypothetical protein